MFSLSVDYMVL
ncbi:hypothetical protein CXB51_024505 [Gossypium anomalum]|uniref:Uncharacterized protein n=1 Tax=Gossypium anomalum TaxID=47600 RepID=A0A8J5YFT5_9ROSI|nr:hypothetical protein CXB51_024505 [Gossypium anomalum]